jgi:single-stranded-DNA-specific exonuclease
MLPKRWNFTPTDENAVIELQKIIPIDPIFCRLLVQQGIHCLEEAKYFFYPSLERLHDPFLMKDMDKATHRLHKAIQQNEKILLYGDYDVDGTTSVAMMFTFLNQQGANLDYYIPDRYKEGYGISFESLDYAKANDVKLIIAMDCGIKAEKQAIALQSLDIDLIICDHHHPGEKIPDALAVLDPKRNDCPYPFKGLSGCGVAFKLVQAYCSLYNLPKKQWESLLDFLVISIAADIVPITGENRTLAHFGLQKFNNTERVGLKALIEHSKRERPLSISDIVFGLAPMINAAGRMADAKTAVQLMLSKSESSSLDYTKALNYRNQLRRDFEQRITEEAVQLFSQNPNQASMKGLILYQEHWHKGVIGIVASRMVEKFYRPSIILTKSGNTVVGSARSVHGYDILKAITSCSDLLLNFGGHKYAAGLTLRLENVKAFCDRFEGVVHTTLSKDQEAPLLNINAELNFKDITPKFRRILSKFAPFGPGNRNPVFQTPGIRDTGYSKVLKEEHLSLSLQQNDSPPFSGIAFGMADLAEKVYSRQPLDMCYNLKENRWQGQNQLQLMVKDIRLSKKGDKGTRETEKQDSEDFF